MTPVPETTVGDVPEMIERVARALVLDYGGHPDQVLGFSSASAALWTFYVPAARAAIAAMREPTLAVAVAVEGSIQKQDAGQSLVKVWNGADPWLAAIDAALGTPPVAR